MTQRVKCSICRKRYMADYERLNPTERHINSLYPFIKNVCPTCCSEVETNINYSIIRKLVK